MFNIKKNNFIKLEKSFFFLFLISLVLCSNIAFGSEVGDLMKAGNDYYQRKQYDKAIDTYQKVMQMGYEGVSLYYNLGDAYYREGKIGYAILFFEKAHRLSPGDNDVNHNLAIANTKTVDKINTMPQFFLFQWWESLLAFFTLTGWTYLAYIFYIFLLVSIGLYFFLKRPRFQRYSFFAGLISLVALVITASLLIIKLNRELNIKSAIIIETSVNVKQAPDPTSSDAFVIHEGLKVREEDHVDNWVKIKLQDGKEGWMPQKDLKTI